MREAKKTIHPPTQVDTVPENVSKVLIHIVIRDLEVESHVRSVFLAELDPDKVLGMIWKSSQDAILSFGFRAMEGETCRSDVHSAYHCEA